MCPFEDGSLVRLTFLPDNDSLFKDTIKCAVIFQNLQSMSEQAVQAQKQRRERPEIASEVRSGKESKNRERKSS